MKKWSQISNQIQRRAAQTGVADMELRAEGQSFPRVTMELVAMELQCCVEENVGALLLIPSQPIQSGNNTFRAMEASIHKRRVHITLYLPPAENYDDKGLISPPDEGASRTYHTGKLAAASSSSRCNRLADNRRLSSV